MKKTAITICLFLLLCATGPAMAVILVFTDYENMVAMPELSLDLNMVDRSELEQVIEAGITALQRETETDVLTNDQRSSLENITFDNSQLPLEQGLSLSINSTANFVERTIDPRIDMNQFFWSGRYFNGIEPIFYLRVENGSIRDLGVGTDSGGVQWSGMNILSEPNTSSTVELFEGFIAAVQNSFNVSSAPVNGTPVPEPAAMLLLGAGLIGLAGYGRKKLI